MDKREGSAGTHTENRSSAIADAVGSVSAILETINMRIGNLEISVGAMYELVKRLESPQGPTSRQETSASHRGPQRPVESISERKNARPSPKTMMIMTMEEEREEQQRALDQIDELYEETRPW